ncbi:MAG: iron complex outermembrane recepter [Desulfobulbaceae bacterium]|nr:MAG: iron complex outermembrane recepter [Desulfobulbaceae bacterium]
MSVLRNEKKVLLAACVIGLVTPFTAIAEDTDINREAVRHLEPVVVTATRTEKTVTNAPGSISVVTKQEIDARNIKSLDEALNTTVGVYNDSKGKGLMGTTSSVSMRGLSYDKRVLFMLDGVPLNEAYTGGVGYQLQSLENIEQIEVVKGASSSLYGGNAMAGVVNIITRMPEKQEITLKTGYGSAWERGDGLDDLSKIYFSYGDKVYDKLSFLAGYGYKETNGYATGLNVQSRNPASSGVTGAIPTTTNTGTPSYLIGDSGDNTWWDDQITLKTAYDLSKTTKADVSFMRSRYGYGYEEPHSYLRNAAGNEVWNYGSGTSTVRENTFLAGDGERIQNFYSANVETEFSKVLAKLTLGYLDIEKNWYVTKGSTAATTRSGGPGTISETPSSSYTGDLQFTLPAGEIQLVTVGASYRHAEADNQEHTVTDWRNEHSTTALTYEAGGKDDTNSLYLQDEISILKDLTLYLGGRQDWWEGSDGYANTFGVGGRSLSFASKKESSFSPKAAVVYKPLDATTLRTSIGQAFRAPNVYDLYRTWVSSTGITYNANPELSPETVTSWEGGVEQGLWSKMTVKATYFHNEMEDMIYAKTISSTRQDKINAGKARSQGVELEAEQGFDCGLTVFANYTYTDSEMLENAASPASVGKELLQVPKSMFNAGARYTHGLLSGSLTGRYVGKRYGNDLNTDIVDGVYTSYDPYTIVDAKVSYQIMPSTVVSVSLDNICDEEYYGYYPGTGRSFFTELTFRF